MFNPAIWKYKGQNNQWSIAPRVLSFPPVTHLCGDQHMIDAFLGQKLLMCPLFYHHSCLEDSDAVCALDGGQTVSHNDTRPALPCLVQRLLHHLERVKGWGRKWKIGTSGAIHGQLPVKIGTWFIFLCKDFYSMEINMLTLFKTMFTCKILKWCLIIITNVNLCVCDLAEFVHRSLLKKMIWSV